MKILIITLLFISNIALGASGKEIWKHTNMKGKVFLLKEYRAFFSHQQSKENLSELNMTSVNFLDYFISSAFAESEMNCIYAGWPSKRVSNSCSSPLKHNPEYKNGSCGQNELQCQPLFFGKGLCVPTKTKEQRSLAFTNCDKKYAQKKESPEALIREIRADGNEKALFELMDFADKMCEAGAQSGTGMCKRLSAAVERMRHFKIASSEPEAQVRGPAISSVVAKTQPEIQDEEVLKQTVVSATEAMKEVNYDKECEPELNGEPFDRDEPRQVDLDFTTSRQGKDPAWDDTFLKDKNNADLTYTGFELSNIGTNDIAGPAIDPREKSERKWRFASEDNSRRETYIWITDDSGSGSISGLMESVIMLVPRKMKPKVEAVGEDLHVTLTTGEKVIYDKNTKMIKAGTLKEGKVDLNPDKRARKFAPITYSGTGISIRVDRRGEDPRQIAGNAVVTQNGKTCQVPAPQLWNKADFRFSDDSKLVEFLNRKCGKKFSL